MEVSSIQDILNWSCPHSEQPELEVSSFRMSHLEIRSTHTLTTGCITGHPVARDHEQDHYKATPLTTSTCRHGEEDASEGWRGGEGEAPEETSQDEPVTETCLSRLASHLPLTNCSEKMEVNMHETLTSTWTSDKTC